jgi:Uma2 family endonuclease
MATQPRPYLTPQEYLEIDRATDHKSEYYAGEALPMTASSVNHETIAANVQNLLTAQLGDRACRVLNLRVRPSANGPYFYPDRVAFCGAPLLEDAFEDTLLDAAVIIEVLSLSTERFDRTTKFEWYKKLPSLDHYLLIAQSTVNIEQRTRQGDDSWTTVVTTDFQAEISLPNIGCTLPVSGTYKNVVFPAASHR